MKSVEQIQPIKKEIKVLKVNCHVYEREDAEGRLSDDSRPNWKRDARRLQRLAAVVEEDEATIALAKSLFP